CGGLDRLTDCCVCCSVFFFQAEDGIRDWSVTGVQTCALPISALDAAQFQRDRAQDLAEPGEHCAGIAKLIEGPPRAQIRLLDVVLRFPSVAPARRQSEQAIEMRHAQ